MAQGFDFTVHRRNAKGEVIAANPYSMTVDGGTRIMERPPGSGIKYYENGEMLEESKKHLKTLEAAQEAKENADREAHVAKVRADAVLKEKAASFDSVAAERDKLLAELAEIKKQKVVK